MNDFCGFLKNCQTPMHFADYVKKRLIANHFVELDRNEDIFEYPTKGFFIENNNSLVAYRYKNVNTPVIIATECESPFITLSPKIGSFPFAYKQHTVLSLGDIGKASIFQRPLKCVGCLYVKGDKNNVEKILFDSNEAVAFFPYPQDESNDGYGLNPMIGLAQADDLLQYISKKLNVDQENILDYNLQLTEFKEPLVLDNGFVAANNLSFIINAYIGLETLLKASVDEKMIVFCVVFNEFDISSNSIIPPSEMTTNKLLRNIGDDYNDSLKKMIYVNLNSRPAFFNSENDFSNVQITNLGNAQNSLIQLQKCLEHNNISFNISDDTDPSTSNLAIKLDENMKVEKIGIKIPIISKNMIREYCLYHLIDNVFQALSEFISCK